MIADVILKVAGFDKDSVPYYPRPSYAGPERCLRAICYEAQGYKKVFPDRFYALLDDSSWHEELTLDLLRKSSYRVHSEQMVVECGQVTHKGRPFTIRGRIDGILTDLLGVDRLLEHKAINHFAFQRYSEEGFPLDYLAQMAFYFVGLSKIQPGITEGILLLKNKNTSQYLEFYVGYCVPEDLLTVKEVIRSDGMRREGTEIQGLYRQSMERFEEVERHVKEGTLPPRPYGPGDWQCQYCAFSEKCDESYVEEFKDFSTEDVEVPELQGLVQEYVSLASKKKDIETLVEVNRKRIREVLKLLNTSRARVDGFAVTLSLQKRTVLDKEKIPYEVVKVAQRDVLSEVLNVRSVKKKN